MTPSGYPEMTKKEQIQKREEALKGLLSLGLKVVRRGGLEPWNRPFVILEDIKTGERARAEWFTRLPKWKVWLLLNAESGLKWWSAEISEEDLTDG